MRHAVFFAALMSLSAAAAAELDYNFVQGSYSQVEFDDIDVDGDGFGLSGSLAIGSSFAIIAGYETGDFDFDVETTAFEIGGLYHSPLTDSVDFVTTLSYLSAEVEVPGFGSADDDGYGVSVGLRGMASPKVELNGGVSYADFGDGGDDTTFGAGFRYHFTEAFSAGLGGSWGDDVSSYGVSGRVAFGH